MRFFWSLAACLALYSCAAQKATLPQQDCTRELGMARGMKDGKAGKKPDFSFLQECFGEARNISLKAYKESFEGTKAKRNRDEETSPVDSVLSPATREPANHNWVCEVEAYSKVFTGSGLSKEEALGSARSTCVSHFQASNCSDSDCRRQNL